jgi:hypothetical protein
VRLNLKNEQMFLDKLAYLYERSKDKNRDWYLDLQKRYRQFEGWYLIIYDGDIKSFSAVHKIDKYYRILSRLWYDESLRSDGLNTPLTEVTPAMIIAELQIEDFGGDFFCSMEYPSRRKHLEAVAERLNYRFNRNFKLNLQMHQTCNHNTFSCWQNTISEIELDLPSISVEEWRIRFGNSRKMPNRKN